MSIVDLNELEAIERGARALHALHVKEGIDVPAEWDRLVLPTQEAYLRDARAVLACVMSAAPRGVLSARRGARAGRLGRGV